MAFDISALTAYVEENKAELILKPMVGSKVFEIFPAFEGIKSGETIPRLESTAPAQSGAACGFNSSGTTTVDQTTITMSSFLIQESLCLKTLEPYFTQKWLAPGSNNETFTKEQMWVNRKLANIARKAGQAIMQGKTTYTNDTYLKRMNGMISIVDTAGNAIAATSQASISTSTVRGIVEEIIFQKLPLAIAETGDEVVLMGKNDYRILLQKLMTDGDFFYNPDPKFWNTNEIVYPGTNVRVIGLDEMNANNTVDGGGVLPTAVKNRILAGSASNFALGFDKKADMSDFRVWWSEDNRDLRFNLEFKLGAAIHFTDQIVQYTNA